MIRTTLAVSFTLALAVLAAGCGKGDAAKTDGSGKTAAFAGSCNKIKKTSKCDEYASLTMGLEESMCKDLGGTFSTTAACPNEAKMGACKKASGSTYYYATTNVEVSYTPDMAKLDCENPLIEGKYTVLGPPPPAAAAAAPSAVAQADAPGATAAGDSAASPAGKHQQAAAGSKAKGHKKGH